MDHSDVIRLNATEKYVLGELPPDLRDQFEEHYFDCVDCASDVKALATFVTASRMIFEQEAMEKASAARQTERRNWWSWFRPLVAAPVIAGLAIAVIFQSAVIIPGLKQRAVSGNVAQVYESSFHLQGATRGEGSNSTVVVSPNQSFALDFDFTPAKSFPSYQGSMLDPSGQPVLTFQVSGDQANKELHLLVPAGKVHPGKYDLVFAGHAANSQDRKDEVQHLSFLIEFRP